MFDEFLVLFFMKKITMRVIKLKSNPFVFFFLFLQQVGRSLFCLGLLIRYGNSLFIGPSNKNIDVASSISLFKKYLLMDDFSIKVRSLQVSPILIC